MVQQSSDEDLEEEGEEELEEKVEEVVEKESVTENDDAVEGETNPLMPNI